METKPDPLFFLVKYVDHTVDMIALWPDEIQTLRNRKGVLSMHKLPDGDEPLALDRDYLVGTKKLKDLDDDDD